MLKMEHSHYASALLQPYYKPCKAKQFLENLTSVRWITVLRHCLMVHGHSIERQETTRNYKKVILYTITRDSSLQASIAVDFS